MSNSNRDIDMYIERKDKVARQTWSGIGIDTKKKTRTFLEKILDAFYIIAGSLILIGFVKWLLND